MIKCEIEVLKFNFLLANRKTKMLELYFVRYFVTGRLLRLGHLAKS